MRPVHIDLPKSGALVARRIDSREKKWISMRHKKEVSGVVDRNNIIIGCKFQEKYVRCA